MMGFDSLSCRCTALHDIRVQRALCQEFEIIELHGFFLEHINKFVTDNFPFLFRIIHTCQLGQEALAGINLNNLHIELANKRLHHALGFAFTQQPMIDEHTS
ncbi:hypothetical protein D3C77_497310 [compost metagenome]